MEYILRKILPMILGDYITGIDKDHMKTDFFSGKVSLEGVSLNPNVLSWLGLPLKIVHSDIGKLEVKIPWMKRLKEPVEIYLEDLLVLVEPTLKVEDYDIVEERIAFLDKLTEQCVLKLKEADKSQDKQDDSYYYYYKVLILDNIQVKIKNIHLRFESPKAGFTAGFTLYELSIYTINSYGLRTFLDRTLPEFKLEDLIKHFDIKDLCWYWNSEESLSTFLTRPGYNANYRKKNLQDYIKRGDERPPGIEPIIMISLECRVIFKNINKPGQEKEPRYKINIDLKPVPLMINNNQVIQFMDLIDNFRFVILNRSKKYVIPKLSSKEIEEETNNYKKALNNFLSKCEELDFKWKDELYNKDRAIEAKEVLFYLSRLPNESITSASKDAILENEKQRILSKFEKASKGGVLSSIFSGKPDPKIMSNKMKEVENSYNKFIKDNYDYIGTFLVKGFLFQVNIGAAETSTYLIHSKSNRGMLCEVKRLNIQFEIINLEEIDMQNIRFSVGDLNMNFIQKYPESNDWKKLPVLKKISESSSSNIFSIIFKRKVHDKKEYMDFDFDFQGAEIKYMPELIVVLRKFFRFKSPTAPPEDAVDYNYEKITDIQKNAQDQFRAMTSANISVILTLGTIIIIFPLDPNKGDASDCWVYSTESCVIQTKTDDVTRKDGTGYDKITYELNKLQVKYYQSLGFYHDMKRETFCKSKAFTVMNDTNIMIELLLLSDVSTISDQKPGIQLTVNIGKISVDLDGILYKRFLALTKCFDFSNEKEFNEYLETEKELIMKNSDGNFIAYFKEQSDISDEWIKYTIVFSGLYIYFFENSSQLTPAKNFFYKLAKITIDNTNPESPYILRIQNNYEEINLSLSSQEDLELITKIMEKRNEKFVKIKDDSPKKDYRAKELDLNTLLIRFALYFEGFGMRLFDDHQNLVNSILIHSLNVNYDDRPLDGILQVDLKDISVMDYKAIKKDEKSILLISSENRDKNQEGKLIKIQANIYQDGHPYYKENFIKKEFLIDFDSLNVNYVPERLYFIKNFFSSEKKIEINPTQYQQPIIETQYISMKSGLPEPVKKYFSGKIKINQLTLTLFMPKTTSKLSLLSLKNVETSISADKNVYIVGGSLEQIECFDLTNYQQDIKEDDFIAPYQLIGCEKGKSLLQFNFESREPRFLQELDTNLQSTLSLKCHDFRINYIQQPILRVIDYILTYLASSNHGENELPKPEEARKLISNPNFLGLEVEFIHPKIIMKPKPGSKVTFELDLGFININNQIVKSSKRILEKFDSIEEVYANCYSITSSETQLCKLVEDGSKHAIIDTFKLDMQIETCPLLINYIIAAGIDYKERFRYLDDSLVIKGSLTPFLLKFDQIDYLDVMDCLYSNLIFDDGKDSIYCPPESIPGNEAFECSPLNLKLEVQHIGVLAIDQISNFPLCKMIMLGSSLVYERKRDTSSSILVEINNVSYSYFEQQPGDRFIYEKTLLGYHFFDKMIDIQNAENKYNALLNSEDILKSRHLKDNHLSVTVNKNLQGNKDISIEVKEAKLLIVLSVIFRTIDFFDIDDRMVSPDIHTNVDPAATYNSKRRICLRLNKAEICVPAGNESTLFITGCITYETQTFDILSLLKKNQDFLDASQTKITFEKSEVFVYHKQLFQRDDHAISKRSIIFPFTFIYSNSDQLCYEESNDYYVSKSETGFTVDRIVMRATSTDSFVALTAIDAIQTQIAAYKQFKPFPPLSPYTEHTYPSVTIPKEEIKSIRHVIKLAQQGIQIRCINDLNGVSIPLVEFNIHSQKEDKATVLEKIRGNLAGRNEFEISLSFFNGKFGLWEPILEKFPFLLDFDFGTVHGKEKRIELASNGLPLNINISDEMLEVILTTYYDWNKLLRQLKLDSSTLINFRASLLNRSKSFNSGTIHSIMSEESTKSQEFISPCTVWNDTGVYIEVAPMMVGVSKDQETIQELYLDVDVQQDLLLEWGVKRAFESSNNQSVLNKMKVDIKFTMPGEDGVKAFDVDIHHIGQKKRVLSLPNSNKKVTLVCHITNLKKKKTVRFCSPFIVKNLLNIKLYVEIHAEEASSIFLEILPKQSKSIPINRLDSLISFHAQKDHKDSNYPKYQTSQIDKSSRSEINFGGHFAFIRCKEQTHMTIINIEPLITIKNCLPFLVSLEIKANSLINQAELATQEEYQVTKFGSNSEISFSLALENFYSNSFSLSALNKSQQPNKKTQELFFFKDDSKVTLDVFIPPVSGELTKQLYIAPRICVLNQTYEKLDFIGVTETSSKISPFVVNIDKGLEVILFDNIPTLRIKQKNKEATYSDPIKLNTLGVTELDLFDGNKKTLNVAVKITNELYDIDNTLFTKVVVVTPRFIFYNKTNSKVSICQYEIQTNALSYTPSERNPFHFQSTTREKNIVLKIPSPKGKLSDWKDSGILDVSSPGDMQFCLQSLDRTEYRFFNLSVTMEDAYLFMTLEEQSFEEAIIKVHNHTAHTIQINQFSDKTHDFIVKPKEIIPFGWTEPCKGNKISAKIILDGTESTIIVCTLDAINETSYESVEFMGNNIPLSYKVTLQGTCRVLHLFSESRKSLEEHKEEEKFPVFHFRADLQAVGISFISAAGKRKLELGYVCMAPVNFVMNDFEVYNEFQLRVGIFMVDNNMENSLYPVMMFPASSNAKDGLPFLDIVCNLNNKEKETDILYVKNFGFYLSEVNICLDGKTINALSDYIRSINKVLRNTVILQKEMQQFIFLSLEHKKEMIETHKECKSWETIVPKSATSEFIFIDKLSINPIVVVLTFKNIQLEDEGSFVFAFLKNALGKALANFDMAPIKLAGIQLNKVFGTNSTVIGTLQQRYKKLTSETIMGVVLSSNIIGNPKKLFDRISTGFTDLVEKPKQGFLEGPLQGSKGIIDGAGSLAKNTVGATFSSIHSITDSLASGLFALSGVQDKEFMETREKTNATANTNVLTGSLQAMSSIGMGVFSGLAGVIEKPLEGGKKDGLKGFFKGALSGAKGLIVKPVAGVIDGVSKMTEGVSNSFVKDTAKNALKSRVPRIFYGYERVFKMYNENEPKVLRILGELKAKYSDLIFLDSTFITLKFEDKDKISEAIICLWITFERVFLVDVGGKKLIWRIKTPNIETVVTDTTGVELIAKKETKYAKNGKVRVNCQEADLRSIVYMKLGILKEVIDEYRGEMH